MKFFDMLLGRTVSKPTPATDPAEFVEMQPDPRGAPGTRVYHEYFVDDEPSPDGKWGWLARVYAQNGAVTEQAGIADARDIARNAALSWCAKTKAGLRGEA